MRISGKHIDLRLAELNDAEFIYQLRTDPFLSRHLPPISPDINQQILWLENYKIREQKGEEYYFVVEEKNTKPCGVLRLYNFQDDTLFIGSWVIRQGCPFYVSIESMLTSYEFGFHTLGFRRMLFNVRKTNLKLIRHHLICGAKILYDDQADHYFCFTDRDFIRLKKKYFKYFEYRLLPRFAKFEHPRITAAQLPNWP